MVDELTWDSKFFNKKIGILNVSAESLPQIKASIEKAKKEGFQYVICKIKSQHTPLIMKLESLGFYLSDIGIIWALEVDKYFYKKKRENDTKEMAIRVATYEDIPMIQEMSESLFLESRFYSDPYFTKEEANNLYKTWAENSVKGEAADVVLQIPNVGFATCKKTAHDVGEIKLIGIKEEFRNRGVGTSLIENSLKWFKEKGVNLVTVRTQLKNISAMNFYLRLGFFIKEYDMIFAKIM